ncbi:cysteine proteinase [Mycena belliarum]|uniref:Cysteine proteinase n=1 Tax=Mycena belliarum TaxID=1033014 RepID=A0AAD6UGK1_9AGAR|nr:cysteine proteinase [Mycena belliae]
MAQAESSATDDDNELMDDLLAQLDSRDETVQQESANVINEMQINQTADASETASKQDPKSRFRARQVSTRIRLSASRTHFHARLRKEAEEEERNINRVCDELNLLLHEINPDGHCLFSAVADQLQVLSIIPAPEATYANIRVAAATYIYTHPDDFLPFLPSAGGEDGTGALDAGLMTPEEFELYCASMRNTAVWGGEPEILALSRAFNVPIHVIQGGQPPVVVHNPTGSSTDDQITDKRVVRISYHRRMYGLGEHYNSLRPKTTRAQISHALHSVLPAS